MQVKDRVEGVWLGREKSSLEAIPIRFRFVVYALFLVVIASAYLALEGLMATTPFRGVLEKLFYSVFIVSFGVMVAEAINVAIERSVDDKKSRYTLKRVTTLSVLLLALFAVLSVVVENWLALAMSLGLIGFGLTYSLQQVITNFFGWVSIMTDNPYSVGDRIMIGDIRGDVVDIGYMSTTMWEFGGGTGGRGSP